MINFRYCFILSIAAGLLWSCAGSPEAPREDVQKHALHHLLVLPVTDMTVDRAPDTSIRSPLSGLMFNIGQVDHLAGQEMTQTLIRQLHYRFPHLKITSATVGLPARDERQGFAANRRIFDAIRDMGRQAAADYVMIGFIYDFRDRSGGGYGVETPAQIAFELNLLQVDSGRLVWQKHFEEKQQPLTEDLFQFKKFWNRKGRWITALEMASSAMKEMIGDLAKKYH